MARLAPVVHLSPLEKDVVQEINLARTQPKTYAAFLEQLRPNYVSGRGQSPGARTIITKAGQTTFVTAEGPKALDQAIAFLRSTPPLPPLTVSRGMSLGSKDHVKEQESTGVIGHHRREAVGLGTVSAAMAVGKAPSVKIFPMGLTVPAG